MRVDIRSDTKQGVDMVGNCNDISLIEATSEDGVVVRDALELLGMVAAIFIAGFTVGFMVAWVIL